MAPPGFKTERAPPGTHADTGHEPQARGRGERGRSFRVEENVWIPMRDGIRLAARLWLPQMSQDAPVPAILEYIPYRKRDLKRLRDSRIHGYFAAHGYAAIRVDLRGSGDSEGVLRDEYLERELADGEEVIAWLAAQPWCDGQVGMIGISWGGFNALQLAARRPPALRAVVAVSASDDRYGDDVHYKGGCLLSDNLSWASTMLAYNAMPPDPEVVGERWREMWRERLAGSGLWVSQWMRHPTRDDYWRHASVCENYAAIRVPVMAVSGWADGYANPVFRLSQHLEAPCKALVGPWGHAYPHLGRPGPAIGFLRECLRWWDQWLGGRETGVMDEPPLRIWLQEGVEPLAAGPGHRPGRWIAEPGWPSPNIEVQRWQPDGRGRLVREHDDNIVTDGPVTVQSPLSVGLPAGKWCSYGSAPDHPYDQREADGGSLVFDCRPLRERLEILGAPAVTLDIAASEPVALLAARVSDLAPDDKALRVTYGVLNLCHRESHAAPTALEPGHRYRVRVPLNHIAHAFAPGHRIRLSLSTSYWPLAWAPPRPVRLTVWPDSIRLELPVRTPNPEDERLAPFAEAEGAFSPGAETLRPGEFNWLITRDLMRDETALHVVEDDGAWRLPEIDLCLRKRVDEWFRYRGDDVTSVSGEVCETRELSRGAWQVRVQTRTLLTCDAECFRVHATVDAWEGGDRFDTRIWHEVIPRRLL